MKIAPLFLFLASLCAVLRADEPFLEKQDLFRVGDNPAYNIYHIPIMLLSNFEYIQ